MLWRAQKVWKEQMTGKAPIQVWRGRTGLAEEVTVKNPTFLVVEQQGQELYMLEELKVGKGAWWEPFADQRQALEVYWEPSSCCRPLSMGVSDAIRLCFQKTALASVWGLECREREWKSRGSLENQARAHLGVRLGGRSRWRTSEPPRVLTEALQKKTERWSSRG